MCRENVPRQRRTEHDYSASGNRFGVVPETCAEPAAVPVRWLALHQFHEYCTNSCYALFAPLTLDLSGGIYTCTEAKFNQFLLQTIHDSTIMAMPHVGGDDPAYQ